MSLTGVPSTPKLICSSSDLDTKESDIPLTCFSTLCTIAARIDTLILHIVTFSTEFFSVGDFFSSFRSRHLSKRVEVESGAFPKDHASEA